MRQNPESELINATEPTYAFLGVVSEPPALFVEKLDWFAPFFL